jgi:hypothetical protein
MKKLTDEELARTVSVYLQSGNQRTAAQELGCAQSRVSDHLAQAKERGLYTDPAGNVDALETIQFKLPPKGKVKRYLLTTCQSKTKLHMPWWKNLLAIAETYDARIMVSTFNYNKDAMGQTRSAKKYNSDADIESDFPADVVPYINNDRVDIAPNLTWCGELQLSPTARRPLVGFENYTYRKSTIVPHTTVAMKSVASMKGEGVKLLYTTGAVSQRNYIQRRIGFQAEHFHVYGALLVEVDANGSWFCRQIEHGHNGVAHDLTNAWKGGKLTSDTTRAACITWGDIHAGENDVDNAAICWGPESGTMLETLRPRSQHLHDLLDMTPGSHHTRRDPHEVYRNYVHKHRRSIMEELRTTAQTAAAIYRPWCRTVDVNSNHTRHLDRMLKEVDWREDMENAELICRLNLRLLEAIRTKEADFYLPEYALKTCGGASVEAIHFLREDQSDVILEDLDGGIECGLHGDRGVNGAKGTVSGIARMGRRVNMADKHSAEIMDGVYVAGTSGKLDAGFNKGPSSWTHSHIVTYPNGTRAIIGVWKGKWKAA